MTTITYIANGARTVSGVRLADLQPVARIKPSDGIAADELDELLAGQSVRLDGADTLTLKCRSRIGSQLHEAGAVVGQLEIVAAGIAPTWITPARHYHYIRMEQS